jgi:hypothetical protein
MYCLALLIVVDSRSRVRSFRGDRNKENGDPPFDTTPTILTLKASPVVNLPTPNRPIETFGELEKVFGYQLIRNRFNRLTVKFTSLTK